MKNKSNHIHHPHVQGRIFLYLRIFYKKYLSFLGVNKILKLVIEKLVGVVANLKNFNFPSKYPWDWKLEMLLYRFEAETVGLAKDIIKPGMTVIDVGAHIGYFTRLFSQLVGPSGKVIAFEPNSDNYELLKKNSKDLNNCSLVNSVVSDKDGQNEFYKITGRSGCHSLIPTTEKHETILINGTRLDTFLLENNIKQVDFIKIDVEGAEEIVLKGAENFLKNSKDITLVMEFNEDFFEGKNPLSFFDYIEELGFSIYLFYGYQLQRFDKQQWRSINYGNEEYVNIVCRK